MHASAWKIFFASKEIIIHTRCTQEITFSIYKKVNSHSFPRPNFLKYNKFWQKGRFMYTYTKEVKNTLLLRKNFYLNSLVGEKISQYFLPMRKFYFHSFLQRNSISISLLQRNSISNSLLWRNYISDSLLHLVCRNSTSCTILRLGPEI